MATIDKSNDSEIRNACLYELGGDEDLIFFDGLDEAIIGVGSRAASPPCVVYDRQRCIELLGEEHFEHNVEQGYVGVNTPIFLTWVRNET